MFEHLINYGAYSEADAARLMYEVASALAFLHGIGVVHCDLKPENCEFVGWFACCRCVNLARQWFASALLASSHVSLLV